MDLKKAEMMAKDVMKHHRLSDWSFQFDRAVRRLGLTSYKKQTISLSLHGTSVNSEEIVLNTILHEVAHVLMGPNAGHGPEWKHKAKEIGCSGERCNVIAVKAPAKYIFKCTNCFHDFHYYRRPKWINRIDSVWCVTCGKEKGKLVTA